MTNPEQHQKGDKATPAGAEHVDKASAKASAEVHSTMETANKSKKAEPPIGSYIENHIEASNPWTTVSAAEKLNPKNAFGDTSVPSQDFLQKLTADILKGDKVTQLEPMDPAMQKKIEEGFKDVKFTKGDPFEQLSDAEAQKIIAFIKEQYKQSDSGLSVRTPDGTIEQAIAFNNVANELEKPPHGHKMTDEERKQAGDVVEAIINHHTIDSKLAESIKKNPALQQALIHQLDKNWKELREKLGHKYNHMEPPAREINQLSAQLGGVQERGISVGDNQ